MLKEQSPPFNPVDNIETIIPWTHYLSRSSLCSNQHWAPKATRPQMFSLSISEKAGTLWNSSSKRNKGRGKSVIEDRGKKGSLSLTLLHAPRWGSHISISRLFFGSSDMAHPFCNVRTLSLCPAQPQPGE